MKIIEKFTRSKTGQEKFNEDCFFIGNNFVVVADGTTSKGANNSKVSAGRIVARFVCDCFKTISSKLEPIAILNTINELLAKELQIKNLSSDFASCSLLIFNAERNEIISYGDCKYKIGDKEYGFENKSDKELAKIRSRVNKKALSLGMTIEQIKQYDLGRQNIVEKLKNNINNANKITKYGYPVINGKGILKQFVSVHKIKCGEVIILSTDGYPKLLSSLRRTEKALMKVLEVDPLCINVFLSTKGIANGNESFDDRTYIRIRV